MSEFIALLSDIHANHDALQAVLQDARARYRHRGKLRYWLLGDLFGRGPDPVAAWTWFAQTRPEVVVAGNHDWALSGQLTVLGDVDGSHQGALGRDDYYTIEHHRSELYRSGYLDFRTAGMPLAEASGAVMDAVRHWPLASMPVPGVVVIHGGAEYWVPPDGTLSDADLLDMSWGYVDKPTHVADTFASLDFLCASCDRPARVEGEWSQTPYLVIAGHLHKRRHAFHDASGATMFLDPVPLDVPLRLPPEPGTRVFASPGSVGFPDREKTLDACYAVLSVEDATPGTITYHAVSYSLDGVRHRMRVNRYPDSIQRRLAPR